MPAGGPSTMNSTRAPGGTPMWSTHSTALSALPFAFIGTPSMATMPSFAGVPEEHGEIQIGDAAGVHHAPELALARLHLEIAGG
jgi:hypothetical protein